MPRLDPQTRSELRTTVNRLAEEANYLSMGRPKSGQFLDELTQNPHVGGHLENFFEKGKVRTYIKDALLNRYSKIKSAPLKPIEHAIVAEWPGSKVIEKCRRLKASVLDGPHGIIVAVECSFVKYETGLRKLLEYLSCDVTPKALKDVKFRALVIHDPGCSASDGGKRTVERALALAGVKAIWI